MKALWMLLFVFIPMSSWAQDLKWAGKKEIKDSVVYMYNPKDGLWRGDGDLKMEKVLTIGSFEAEDKYCFNWVSDVATDSEGNIYVCDSRDQRVQLYTKKGKYIRTIGRQGEGPGEFLRPKCIAVDSMGNLYVRSDLNFRITRFGADGEYVSSFQYPNSVGSCIEISKENNVLLDLRRMSSDENDHSFIVTEFTQEGKEIRKYGQSIKILEKGVGGMPMFSSHYFSYRPDGQLLIGFTYPYRIEIFYDGCLKKVIERESPVFTKPKIYEVLFSPDVAIPAKKQEMIKMRSGLWGIYHLPDGKMLAVIRDAGKDYEDNSNVRQFAIILDLFDSDGRFLKSYNWDWEASGLIMHVDAEGFLYSNCGDTGFVPGVSKWKVAFD